MTQIKKLDPSNVEGLIFMPCPRTSTDENIVVIAGHCNESLFTNDLDFVGVIALDSPYRHMILAAPLLANGLGEAIQILENLRLSLHSAGLEKLAESLEHPISGLQASYQCAFDDVSKIARKLRSDHVVKD